MTIKPDIKWLNKNQVRKTLSNMTFSEDLVYPAHSTKHPGFSPYVSMPAYDLLLETVKKYAETEENYLAKSTLKALGE